MDTKCQQQHHWVSASPPYSGVLGCAVLGLPGVDKEDWQENSEVQPYSLKLLDTPRTL